MIEKIAEFTTTNINHPLSYVSTNPFVIYRKVIDTLNNIDYRFESTRLKSFKNWPHIWTKSIQFAAAGFYYTGESDTVKCFECDIEIHTWLLQHDPMLEHIRWSKTCSFVRNYRCGNVPIGADSYKISSFMREEYDTCEFCEANMMISLQLEKNIFEDINAKKTEKISSNLSAIIPKYPEYASYDARLRTYEMSPKILSQTKEEFAAAGLFYAGNDDQTLCYHCGGELKFWKLEDDPWEHHAKCFNHCPYLHMVKGTDYINRVIKKIYSEPDTRNIWEPSIEQDAKFPPSKLSPHEGFQDLTSFKSIYGTVPFSTYIIGTKLSEPDITEPSIAQGAECPFNDLFAHESFQDLISFENELINERVPTYITPKLSEPDITEPPIAQELKDAFDDPLAHENFQDLISFENELINEGVPTYITPKLSEPDITEPPIAQELKDAFDDPLAHENFQDLTSSENESTGWVPLSTHIKIELSEPDTRNILEPSIEQDAKCPLSKLFAHECYQNLPSFKSIYGTVPFSTYVVGMKLSEPDITELSIAQELEDVCNDLLDHKSSQDLISFEDESTDDK